MVNETLRLVILGGTGFVGSAVLERLSAMPPGSVRANILVRDKNKINPYPFADVYTGELPRIPEGLFPSNPHVVLHFANKNIDRSGTGFEINLRTAEALINAVNQWTMGMVYGSSLSVYGQGAQNGVTESDRVNPQTPLALSRLSVENILQKHATEEGKSVLLLRPRFVIGNRDAYTMPAFVKIFGKGFQVGAGTQKYSFIDVSDYAEIIVRLCSVVGRGYRVKSGLCTPVNIGYRRPVSLNEVHEVFHHVFGPAEKPVLRIPAYRWLPGIFRGFPLKGAQQLATRFELLGFSHYSDVRLLTRLIGEDIPAKDPLAVLEKNFRKLKNNEQRKMR